MLNCRPNGQRCLGIPLNRLLEEGQNKAIKAYLVMDDDYDDECSG